VVIEGDASSRCGISMKGVDIVVGGSVGHVSAFMAQAGTLVICGDAAAALGDSLYEAVIYVRGKIQSLGADAREEAMGPVDHAKLKDLLGKAGINYQPKEFKRVASARSLYHWNSDAHQEY
jgi:glutamate synthase domain-containing protein 3